MNENEVDTNNLSPAIFITLTRIYDVLLALLDNANPQTAGFLKELHAQGGIIMAEPFIDPDVVEQTRQLLNNGDTQ